MKRILFVCTGNTCRSPMAECMLRALLADQHQNDIQVLSAGTYALSGAPASLGAQRAVQRRGLSLADHKSRAVTGVLLESCDLIVGLTKNHVLQLRMMYPQCQTPMIFFGDPPVSDPYGGDDTAYEQAARDIQRQLPALLQKL
ncbi:MAG: low molecular weight protein arginine phosphatase [Clostridia bacterium]|nr:low molecular weight protein arginine phosphatase [Clostridia bacterium]